jgi:hypothetical protein
MKSVTPTQRYCVKLTFVLVDRFWDAEIWLLRPEDPDLSDFDDRNVPLGLDLLVVRKELTDAVP